LPVRRHNNRSIKELRVEPGEKGEKLGFEHNPPGKKEVLIPLEL
jgi:hypothetical protein